MKTIQKGKKGFPKKSLLCLLVCLIPIGDVWAQFKIVTDPGLTKVAAIGNSITMAIQEINKTTAQSVQALNALTQDYQKALSNVNAYIGNSAKVKEIFDAQKKILALYQTMGQYDAGLTGDEQRLVHTTMKNSLTRSTGILTDLQMVIKPAFYKMTDKERLDELDKIYDKMLFQYNGMTSFMNKIALYTNQQQTKKSAQADALTIYGSHP